MKFIGERIDTTWFLISLSVGLLICYLLSPTPTVIFEHPTPDNTDSIIYSEDDKCYKYEHQETNCNHNTLETPKM